MDLTKLMSVAGSSEVGKNADSLMGMIQTANKYLTEFQKTTNMLNKMGVLPGALRAIGKQMDIDVDTPLKTSETIGIVPKSATHELYLNAINIMTDEELKILSQAIQAPSKEAVKDEPKNK